MGHRSSQLIPDVLDQAVHESNIRFATKRADYGCALLALKPAVGSTSASLSAPEGM